MTSEELRSAGEALYGEEFVGRLADALAVHIRTMQRWLSGEKEIPDGVRAELIEMLANRRGEFADLIATLEAAA